MVFSSRQLFSLALSAVVVFGGSVRADSAGPKVLSFGALEPVSLEEVRAQAEVWFNQAVKDSAKRIKFEAIWQAPDQPILDRVADTLALDPTAAQLLAEARNLRAPPPTEVPALLRDAAQPTFYRANLGLAYAKALSLRRVFEEALDALKTIKPEEVVDPGTYFFHRAVAEYSLIQKENARRSIDRLLNEVAEAPERYKTVATLMLMDMLTWKDKSLDDIARKMASSGRRLELGRGGPITQKIQRDIVNRLDELIKALEKKSAHGVGPNGGGCPDGSSGRQPGGADGGQPKDDSDISITTGDGKVNTQRLRKIAARWGSMPEKDRQKILQDLTRDMSDKNAQAIITYFKRLSEMRKK
jgi:hypothetical protein